MKGSRNRALSVMILLVFSLVIFCSSLFIITNADHECCGEGCSVCTELAECLNNLHTAESTVSGAVQPAILLIAVFILINAYIRTRSGHSTLISLKVELLN